MFKNGTAVTKVHSLILQIIVLIEKSYLLTTVVETNCIFFKQAKLSN